MSKLLIFTENYARGGGNRYMIDMVNALDKSYDLVTLASNASGIFKEDTVRLNRLTSEKEVLFVTRARISNYLSGFLRGGRVLVAMLFILEPIFFLLNVLLFALLIRKEKPAMLLSCNGGYPAAQGCLAMVIAGKIMHTPVVMSVVSMPTRRRLMLWLYEKTVDYVVWKSASTIIVNAMSIADALCQHRDAPIGKMRVVHNGLEDTPLPTSHAKKKNGQVVVGCLARMDKAKGVLFLLEAFVRLVRNHPELRLVLAGQGDASAQLVRRIEMMGLRENVKLLGHYQGDVGVLLDSFDIYVFPSLWEGFPYSLVEALRAECVIVATRVGGIPEAVNDGEEGLLIEPGSVDAIVKAVERVLADRNLGKLLAKNARLKFERDLTLPKMHDRVRVVFAELEAKEWQ